MLELAGKIVGGFKILERIRCSESDLWTVFKAVLEHGMEMSSLPRGQVVVLTVFNLRYVVESEWEEIENRVSILSQMSHPNLARYYGCFRDEAIGGVVIREFVEGVSLKDLIRSSPTGIDTDKGLQVADALLAGFSAAAKEGIVHGNICPDNVMLGDSWEDGGSASLIKIIGFEYTKRNSATVRYWAPECDDSAFKSDMISDEFSLGMTLHEMLSGVLPPQIRPLELRKGIYAVLPSAEKLFSMSLAFSREKRFSNWDEFQAERDRIHLCSLTRTDGRSYVFLRFIGEGGCGKVFKVRSLDTQEIFAIKQLNDLKLFKHETDVLAKLVKFNDPSIVRFIERFTVQGNNYFLMEFLPGMPGLSLANVIKETNGRGVPVRDVLRMFKRYAHGLKLLHDAKIYHRDIKPANLYFPKGHPESASIMDLGIARDISANGTITSWVGTKEYVPPEYVTDMNRGDSRRDIYALGLCLYEALTTQVAVKFKDPSNWIRELPRCKPCFKDDERRIPTDVLCLIRGMTARKPRKRIADAGVVEQRLEGLLKKLDEPSWGEHEFWSPFVEHVHRFWFTVMDQAAERQLVVSIVAGAVLLGMGSGFLLCVWPVLKVKYAERKLVIVLNAYRHNNPEAEEIENRWIVDFNPESSSHLRLTEEEYRNCTNRIVSVKMEMRQGVCVDKYAPVLRACVIETGVLNYKAYAELSKWIPLEDDTLNGTTLREHKERLCRAVVLSLNQDLDTTAVLTRLERLQCAKEVLDNNWTRRLLPESQYKMFRNDLKRKQNMCVGRVYNHCCDEVEVCGVVVPAQKMKVVVVEDGHPENYQIIRKGFRPLQLPSRFEGQTVDLANDDFKRDFVTGIVPELEKNVSLVLQGKTYVSGAKLELVPGVYNGIYTHSERTDEGVKIYEDIPIEVRVPVGGSIEMPKDTAWTYTADYQNWLNKQADKNLAQVEGELNTLLVWKPITTRRKRLARAADLLAEARVVQLFGQDRVANWKEKVAKESALVVGVVSNSCSGAVTVGTLRIEPQGETVVAYSNSNREVQGVVAQLDGREDRWIGKELDGSHLVLTDDLFAPKGVRVTIPDVGTGVACYLEDRPVSGTVELRPGDYSFRFTREDYEDQRVLVRVKTGTPVDVEQPKQWVPGGDLQKLVQAEDFVMAGKLTEARRLSGAIQVRAAEHVARLQTLQKKIAALTNQKEKLITRIEVLLEREPIATRRERLVQAENLLEETSVIQLFEPITRERWKQKVCDEKDRVVGTVRNSCDAVVMVGNLRIEPGKEKVVVNSKNLQGVLVKYYGRKDLLINKEKLDGSRVELSDDQFEFEDVLVRVSELEDDVVCRVGDKMVHETFRIQPGHHELVFERKGYETQRLRFVAKIAEGANVRLPGSWQALPVDVTIPDQKTDVVCYLGERVVNGMVKLVPGKYVFRYVRKGYEDQNVYVKVLPNHPVEIPLPAEWKPSGELKILIQIEALVKANKLEAAEKLIRDLTLDTGSAQTRLRKLKDQIRQSKIRGTIQEAERHFHSKLWRESVESYYVAFSLGGQLTDVDKSQLDEAYYFAKKDLKAQQEKIRKELDQRGHRTNRNLEEVNEKINKLDWWFGKMGGWERLKMN